MVGAEKIDPEPIWGVCEGSGERAARDSRDCRGYFESAGTLILAGDVARPSWSAYKSRLLMPRGVLL